MGKRPTWFQCMKSVVLLVIEKGSDKDMLYKCWSHRSSPPSLLPLFLTKVGISRTKRRNWINISSSAQKTWCWKSSSSLYWSLTHHNNVFHLCRDKFMIHVVPCSTINMPTTFDKVHNLLNPKSYALTQFINILYSLNSEKQNFRARWSQQCWIWYKAYSAICFSKLDIYVCFGYMIYEANFISQWKNSTIKQVW